MAVLAADSDRNTLETVAGGSVANLALRKCPFGYIRR